MNEKIIFLIEDNPDDEALTIRALKKNKICNEVVVARDGNEALEYLLDKGRPLPAVVLLDLKLPKIDGLEVLRRLRMEPRTKLLPVVILTSSKEQQDLVGGYSNGANSYILKPVDFSQFAESARLLGMYWLMLNQPPPPCEGVS
jgi:CheY-like chemotaxis protein